jgi:ribosomal protein S18 acetylase RimI-like enzyme
VRVVTDRAWLRERLVVAPALNVYALGDLDDRFWPHTKWFARGDAIALIYSAGELPVLLCQGDGEHAALVAELRDELPATLYAHLSPALVDELRPRFATKSPGPSSKMGLVTPRLDVDTSRAERLAPADRDELIAFYARAYPGNWFDPRMLETGQYFAIRDGGALVAAAGIHVYSKRERCAALGNIAVDPDARGGGLGQVVTAAVCKSLLVDVDVDRIGLNVRTENRAAVACYSRLGFAIIAPYEEHLLTA